jgi:hypothetical protein
MVNALYSNEQEDTRRWPVTPTKKGEPRRALERQTRAFLPNS